ncbi:MAG: MarR family winged helix-turn-helix transcriptional regulator [Nocardioides sp.]
MPDQHTLAETERAMNARVGHLPLDFAAAQAVSSIYRAANAARSHLTNSVLRRHELTWTGFLVLWLLWIWDRMETRRVAENVGISKATLSGVANTLVSRGFIRRVDSAIDRRLVELELTEEGEVLMEQLFPEFNAAEARLVADIPADQMTSFTGCLRQIVTTAEELERSR